jgi:4,5-dihydroxyphthalate decarboxylase
MARLSLSVCLSRNPMTHPILSGQVSPEGIEWIPSGVHPSEMFWRQLKYADFDVSEMSLSSLSIAASRGMRDWTAIPVFTTRRFFHTGIVVRAGAGIERPQDLAGKRVGVPEYQQTAALWARGALDHEFGVSPGQVRWFMERQPERSHGGSTGFVPPPGVQLDYIDPFSSIGAMLENGQLDAALVYLSGRNLVDRTPRGAAELGVVRPLFADPVAEGQRYYAKTGILPVNHVVVVRTSLLERHPWIALNVFSAFVAAKRAVFSPLTALEGEIGTGGGLLEPWLQIGAIERQALARLTEVDPLPYGLAAQGAVLDTLADYLAEQQLVSERLDVTELFAATTREL